MILSENSKRQSKKEKTEARAKIAELKALFILGKGSAAVIGEDKLSLVAVKDMLGDFIQTARNINEVQDVARLLLASDYEPSLINVSFDWNDDSRGYDLVSIIRQGINYKTFQSVANTTPLKDTDWATILDTTTRTLERYKKDNKTFSSTQSEKIIEIQQLMKYGGDVFEDRNNFEAWLTRENISLGGTIPKNLLDTSLGLSMVKDALGRIEHGIFA